MQIDPAVLTLGHASPIEVAGEDRLEKALKDVGSLEEGQVVALRRGSKDYIKATRRGELWSVVARRSGMWTPQSFTASFTTENSERLALESRERKSLIQRLIWMLRSPPPQKSLTATQVKTLFAEYLLGRKFSIPMLGA